MPGWLQEEVTTSDAAAPPPFTVAALLFSFHNVCQDARMQRNLVLMGSGETSPTMINAHRELLTGVPSDLSAAVLLDTTYGFQENADELTARIVTYFDQSVGRRIQPLALRSIDDAPAAHAQAIAAIGRASWLFAGPGSPTYALRVWQETGANAALLNVLQRGTVVLASAAALTAGCLTVPVYEIYKVGERPSWVPGMDLVGQLTGLHAAVIPHFDNAEGGNHDTRYCYMGERRLEQLEALLPSDCFVLGIDEHTGIRLDLDDQRIHVFGRGGMTIRMRGQSWTVPSGHSESFADIAVQAGTQLASVETSAAVAWADVSAVEAMLDEGRVSEAVDALLAIDGVDRDINTRAAVHSLVVRLGQLAASPDIDMAGVIGPFVEALLEARSSARRHGFWDEADAIRSTLNSLQVNIKDTPDGSTWSINADAAL